jgi:hypothetical protein
MDKDVKKGHYTDFKLLAYEHLFAFRKPEEGKDLRSYKTDVK